jgi:hypothetical protein
MCTARLPYPGKRIAEGRRLRIGAQDERAPEVRLPPLKDRAEVEENNVVVDDHPVGGRSLKGCNALSPARTIR